MKKKIIFITTILFCNGLLFNSPMKAWGFSNLFFKETRKAITEMEKSFEELKQEFSQIKLFSPTVISDYNKNKGIYFIQVELPGYEEKNITIKAKISDNQRLLTINAKQEKNKDSVERKKAFQMTKTIPQNVILEKASWTYKNGILRIEFPTDNKKVDVIEIKKAK